MWLARARAIYFPSPNLRRVPVPVLPLPCLESLREFCNLHGKAWQKRLLPATHAMEEMLIQQEPNAVKEEKKAGTFVTHVARLESVSETHVR